MKNQLNEILSLMYRMGLILEDEAHDDDNLIPNKDAYRVNNGRIFVNKAPRKIQSPEDSQLNIQFDQDLEDEQEAGVNSVENDKINNTDNCISLPEAIKSAKLAYKDHTRVTLGELITAFESIKGKTVFYQPGCDLSGYDKNIKDLCIAYNDKIAKNICGRLGNTLELLFGKEPDSDKNSDFGYNNGEKSGVELKTKHDNALSNVISITRQGIENTGKLLAGNKVICQTDRIENFLNTIIDSRIEKLDRRYWDGIDIIVSGKKDSTTKNVSRKTLRTAKSIGRQSGSINGDVVIKDTNIAVIEIRYNLNTLEKYDVWISGVLKIEGELVCIELTFTIKSEIHPEETRTISAEIPLNTILKKIEYKCPTLMIAFGDEDVSNIDGRACETYVYNSAKIFEWGGLSGDKIALYLINSGLIKVNFGLKVSDVNRGNTIYPNCNISLDYIKLLESLKLKDTNMLGGDKVELFKYKGSI